MDDARRHIDATLHILALNTVQSAFQLLGKKLSWE